VIDVIKASEENVAKGEDAQSVLQNTTTRNLFINELIEVRAHYNYYPSNHSI
jgi:hypothetical protein